MKGQEGQISINPLKFWEMGLFFLEITLIINENIIDRFFKKFYSHFVPRRPIDWSWSWRTNIWFSWPQTNFIALSLSDNSQEKLNYSSLMLYEPNIWMEEFNIKQEMFVICTLSRTLAIHRLSKFVMINILAVTSMIHLLLVAAPARSQQ